MADITSGLQAAIDAINSGTSVRKIDMLATFGAGPHLINLPIWLGRNFDRTSQSNVWLKADGVSLTTTNPRGCGLQVYAHNSVVTGWTMNGTQFTKLTSPNTTQDACGIYVHGCMGAHIEDCHVQRMANRGMLAVNGATGFGFYGCSVTDNSADSFDSVSSSFGTFEGCVATNSGDDGLFIGGGQSLTAPKSTNITVRDFVCNGHHFPGRGIAILGADNVTLKDWRVFDTDAAGLMIGSEAAWNQPGCNNIYVGHGYAVRSNFNSADASGAVHLCADTPGQMVSNITLENIVLWHTIAAGQNSEFKIHNGGDAGVQHFSNVLLKDVRARGSGPATFASLFSAAGTPVPTLGAAGSGATIIRTGMT